MKKIVILLVVVSILFNFFNVISWIYFAPDFGLSGHVFYTSLQGILYFFVEGDTLSINITSPRNITYNSSITPYAIALNVSSDFNATSWRYTLYDLTNNQVVNESVSFSPNSTIYAVARSNRLSVYANSTNGQQANSTVVFYVSVPNSAPDIEDLPDLLYACEQNFFSYSPILITDLDGDPLTLDLSPKNPFFLFPMSTSGGSTTVSAGIFTGTLGKGSVGFYHEIISVTDGTYADTESVNISVIETNNAPSIQDIGAKTVWLSGQNSTFNYTVQVNDIEDGSGSSGNLTFNMTFLTGSNLFNISSVGFMNFTPSSGDVGVYNISVCVRDLGLSNPSPNITLCGETGAAKTSCKNFSLTVTSENRAPTIDSYNPLDLTLNTSGSGSLSFSTVSSDPDGTVPDTYWYVDGQVNQHTTGTQTSNFTNTFGCGVSGNHIVSANVSDGALTDSIQWSVNVTLVACAVSSTAGGAAGGGGGFSSALNWGCGDWSSCQYLNSSFSLNVINNFDYDFIKDDCRTKLIPDARCGYQIRSCLNLTTSLQYLLTRPSEIESCYFVTEPGCYDGIKDCHHGSCELLTDCGGPCGSCPTCSDGIMNQKESGIDCGGPCPRACTLGDKVFAVSGISTLFTIIAILLILAIVVIIIRIYIIRRRIKRYERRRIS